MVYILETELPMWDWTSRLQGLLSDQEGFKLKMAGEESVQLKPVGHVYAREDIWSEMYRKGQELYSKFPEITGKGGRENTQSLQSLCCGQGVSNMWRADIFKQEIEPTWQKPQEKATKLFKSLQ